MLDKLWDRNIYKKKSIAADDTQENFDRTKPLGVCFVTLCPKDVGNQPHLKSDYYWFKTVV